MGGKRGGKCLELNLTRLRGNPEVQKFICIYLASGRLIAVEYCVQKTRSEFAVRDDSLGDEVISSTL